MPWYTTADAVRDAQKPQPKWVLYDFDECPICGGDAEILTLSNDTSEYYDGDKVRCCECGHTGQFDCDRETDGSISWHDEI